MGRTAAPAVPARRARVQRAEGTNSVIYSAGPNVIDDGGKRGDVTLEHHDNFAEKLLSEALSAF